MEPSTKRLKSDNADSDEEWARFEADIASSSESPKVSALDAAVIEAEPVKLGNEETLQPIETIGTEEGEEHSVDYAEEDANELLWEEEEKQEELNARLKKMKELYRSVKSTQNPTNSKQPKLSTGSEKPKPASENADKEGDSDETEDEEYDEDDVWK